MNRFVCLFLSCIMPICIFATNQSYGNSLTLLKCLGKEELYLHQNKITGPVYLLNQLLINKISSIENIPLKKESLKKICHRDKVTNSVAVNLLYYLLIEGKNIFHVPKNSISMGLNALISDTHYIFFKHLSRLQGETATHDCLEKKIPEIKYFSDRFKTLLPNVPTKNLFKEKDRLEKIFKSLRQLNTIMEQCAYEKEIRQNKNNSQ